MEFRDQPFHLCESTGLTRIWRLSLRPTVHLHLRRRGHEHEYDWGITVGDLDQGIDLLSDRSYSTSEEALREAEIFLRELGLKEEKPSSANRLSLWDHLE